VLKRNDPANKIAFAVDEWGTWYDAEPNREPGFLYQQNTLRDALVAAINFNIFHHHADRVRMANIAQMVNVLQAMILTDGAKMVLTPTYHVFSMYKPFQDATYLPSEVARTEYRSGKLAVPKVNVSAARTAAGEVVVGLVNLDPHAAADIRASLAGVNAKSVQGTILTAGAMDARNTFEAPHAIEPKPFKEARLAGGQLSLSLPAKSVLVLTLK
jgi:alpha-N-arabinofuranosidase